MSYLHPILLAEDDDQYAFIIQLALTRAGIDNPVHCLATRELVPYLSGTGPYANRAAYPLPVAVLLSLRPPLLEDFGPLRWIRARPELSFIRIAVLDGIDYPPHRAMADQLGAQCYEVKPPSFEELIALARRIRHSCLELTENQAAA